MLNPLAHVQVEPSAKTFVRCYYNHLKPAGLPYGEQGMGIERCPAEQPVKYLGHPLMVGPPADGRFLRPFQPGGSNHLHGPGNLLRFSYGGYPPLYVSQCCHDLCLRLILACMRSGFFNSFKIRNPNIETRNKFKYQMTKIPNARLLSWMFWSLEHFDLFLIVSDVEFRASNLQASLAYGLKITLNSLKT
jgi:hypothetical protein